MENKERIGQVTYCNGNFGSILQCYATQKIIKKMGYKPILLIRDEHGLGRKIQAAMFRINKYWMYIKYHKYRKKFDEILNSYKNSGNGGFLPENNIYMKEFINNEINYEKLSYRRLKKLAYSNYFKAFISGSDQIWSGSWFIKNPMWFLRFAPKNKRIAWAPSFGTDKLAEYNESTYRKYINDYKFLSVRETSGVEIVKDLINKSVIQVLDPTLLLDKKEWDNELSTKLSLKERYICLFFLDRPNEIVIKYIKKIQEETQNKVYAFGYWYDNLKEIFQCEPIIGGPKEFLYIIKNANLICTDSFHGTVFSINFEKNFLVFKRNYNHSSDQSTRIESILKKCELESKFLSNLDFENIDLSHPDFTVAKNVLKIERKNSIEFLRKSIDAI